MPCKLQISFSATNLYLSLQTGNEKTTEKWQLKGIPNIQEINQKTETFKP